MSMSAASRGDIRGKIILDLRILASIFIYFLLCSLNALQFSEVNVQYVAENVIDVMAYCFHPCHR